MKKLNPSFSWLLIACCFLGQSSLAQNAITDWAVIVQPAILNPRRPPASSEVLHAMSPQHDDLFLWRPNPYNPQLARPGHKRAEPAVLVADAIGVRR